MNEIDFIDQVIPTFEDFDRETRDCGIAVCPNFGDFGYTVTSEHFDEETYHGRITIEIKDGVDKTIGNLSVEGYPDEVRSSENEVTIRYVIEANLKGDIEKIMFPKKEGDIEYSLSKSA